MPAGASGETTCADEKLGVANAAASEAAPSTWRVRGLTPRDIRRPKAGTDRAHRNRGPHHEVPSSEVQFGSAYDFASPRAKIDAT